MGVKMIPGILRLRHLVTVRKRTLPDPGHFDNGQPEPVEAGATLPQLPAPTRLFPDADGPDETSVAVENGQEVRVHHPESPGLVAAGAGLSFMDPSPE